MPLFTKQPVLTVPAAVTATGTITTTSTTDVLATGMTSTPPAGTYLVFFTGSVWCTTQGAGLGVFTDIWAGGAVVTSSQVQTADGTNFNQAFCSIATVTVNGAQAIEGRWRIVAGSGTASMVQQRTLTLVQIG